MQASEMFQGDVDLAQVSEMFQGDVDLASRKGTGTCEAKWNGSGSDDSRRSNDEERNAELFEDESMDGDVVEPPRSRHKRYADAFKPK